MIYAPASLPVNAMSRQPASGSCTTVDCGSSPDRATWAVARSGLVSGPFLAPWGIPNDPAGSRLVPICYGPSAAQGCPHRARGPPHSLITQPRPIGRAPGRRRNAGPGDDLTSERPLIQMQILPDPALHPEHPGCPTWCSPVACYDDRTIREHRSFPVLIASQLDDVRALVGTTRDDELMRGELAVGTTAIELRLLSTDTEGPAGDAVLDPHAALALARSLIDAATAVLAEEGVR
jgi:hypothetical protein